MPKYRINYQETVWGFAEIEAESEDEASDIFSTGDCDMTITNSEIVSEEISLS